MGLIFRKNYQLSQVVTIKELIGLMMMSADEQTTQVNDLGNKMSKQNLSWFVLQHDMTIHTMPKANQMITIETEPLTYNAFFTFRRFVVWQEDEKCIESIFKFAMIDMAERKMIRVVDDLLLPYSIEKNGKVEMAKIKVAGEPELLEQLVVDTAFIDSNGHVNNACYVDLVLQHETNPIQHICVIYDKETFLGETLQIKRHCLANQRIYTIEKDDNSAVRIVIL